MKKIYLFLLTLCFGIGANSQIVIDGNNYLNKTPLKNTLVIVKSDGKVLQTMDTKNNNNFLTEDLEIGKVYQIYLQNPKCVVMYFEVVANDIPKNKSELNTIFKMDIPFVNKNDPDIDTSVFQKPFNRVIFNGKKAMMEDEAYNNAFVANMMKKKAVATETTVAKTDNEPTLFAGKVFLNNDKLQPAKNKPIVALNNKGQIIKSTSTNRFGAFTFTDVKPVDVAIIKMDLSDVVQSIKTASASGKVPAELTEMLNGMLGLYNSKSELLQLAKPTDGFCVWDLNAKSSDKLRDENYSTNIGGKLVSSSSKEKKFFAEKNVYLSNKLNTVIKKTKTNKMGSFVFEDIKPDKTYYIGVDHSDLAPGEKVDLLTAHDAYIATLDTMVSGRNSLMLNSSSNKTFNNFTIGEDEMKMDIKATIFGDNVNQPIGKLKIILLNDTYQPIDSVITDDFGAFKFKYLPFLKRFYLSAENKDNILDVYKNILIYSNDQTLVKVMTHQKGTKFTYNPVSAELSSLRDVELEDPWLEFVDGKKKNVSAERTATFKPKSVIENILFENKKYNLTPDAKQILDKIILVLNTNKQLKIEIGAHTDSKGTTESNQKLSELRAKTVRDYIVNAGIAGNRINSIGYGESKLLNDCGDNKDCSEAEHAMNRRIEFKILGE